MFSTQSGLLPHEETKKEKEKNTQYFFWQESLKGINLPK